MIHKNVEEVTLLKRILDDSNLLLSSFFRFDYVKDLKVLKNFTYKLYLTQKFFQIIKLIHTKKKYLS